MQHVANNYNFNSLATSLSQLILLNIILALVLITLRVHCSSRSSSHVSYRIAQVFIIIFAATL